MLTRASFLAVVLSMTACRTPEPITELHQESEAPGPKVLHGLLEEHYGEPAFEPVTRQALSADEACVLAARLANEQCERQYRRRPFKPEQYPAILQDGAYHWGKLDVGGHAGFSASVVFYPDGTDAQVEVYFSSDTVLGLK